MPPEGQGHLGAVAGGAQVDLYDARFEPLPLSFQTYSALTRRPPLALAVQAKKFTALDGASEQQGDLKSIVLHNMKYAPKRPTSAPRPPLAHAIAPFHRLQHVKSSFPLAVGAEISAVDNDCFSSTGKPFSFIALGNAESSQEKVLQEDDISLAYEFASKFPGYTAECAAFRARPSAICTAYPPPLAFAATSRRKAYMRSRPAASSSSRPSAHAILKPPSYTTALLTPSPLARSHPIVSAISENADKLQVRNFIQSLHANAISHSRVVLLRRWARSR